MSTVGAQIQTHRPPSAPQVPSLSGVIFRLFALAVIDAFALWFVTQVYADGNAFLAVIVALVTLMINVIFLHPSMYALRWLSPGMALSIIMVLYPTLFTVYVSLTNFGTGHLLTRQVAIEQLEREQYLPEEGQTYSWTGYRSANGNFALWLVSDSGESFLARPGQPLEAVTAGQGGVGEFDENGIPVSIEGYERLSRGDTLRFLSDLDELIFGEAPDTVEVTSLNAASRLEQRYIYDAVQDAMIDRQTGMAYKAIDGTFTSESGEQLRPGFWTPIGFRNYERLLNSPALQGPFILVFLWTFAHAVLAVLLTFSLGLFLAMVFNHPKMRGRKVIRSLMLISYAIPAFVSVPLWRGLLNPQLGVISTALAGIFGSAPPWFSDPLWSKIGILIIQLWLGFPYMLLINTGALQAIPSDLYEAAEVDGANSWHRFRHITLPLLLVSVGPLLIASFAFNFNNFTVIDLYNEGGPPIAGTTTPAGHTDILMTYTFRLAFASGRGSDLGFAATITFVIFVILTLIVLFQFRYTRVWEEVSENV